MSPAKIKVLKGEELSATLFVLPASVFYVLFLALPLFATMGFSFYSIDRMTLDAEFIGLDNWIWVFSDKRFWLTFANTFTFVTLAVIGNVGLGLLFAVLLNRSLPVPLLYVFRLCFFLPVLVSLAFSSFVWKFLFNTDLGVINFYLREWGLPGVGWLSDSSVAMLSVVIMDVWKNFGFYMIIFLAALQGVPKELLEAAQLDGANRFQRFIHITLPSISPVVVFSITFATITGLQVFDSVKILTDGGPGDSTRTAAMYMVSEAFSVGDISTASVAALTLLAAILLIAVLQVWFSRRLAG